MRKAIINNIKTVCKIVKTLSKIVFWYVIRILTTCVMFILAPIFALELMLEVLIRRGIDMVKNVA